MVLSYKKNFIDFHTHIFPEKLYSAIKSWFLNNVGWNFDFKGSSMEVFSFLNNIDNLEYFICFGYAHKKDISSRLNEFYISLKSLSPKVIPLGTIHQDDVDLIDIAKKAMDGGLKGFKIHCQVQKVTADDKRFHKFYEYVGDRGGFILFHAGTGPFPNDFVGFCNFERFIKKFPNLKCIVAHLGAFESDKFIKASLDYKNLYLDTSYTFISNPTNTLIAPVELLLEAQEKILFGSDFPGICHSYESSVSALTNLCIPEDVLDKIFYENAYKFLKSLSTV